MASATLLDGQPGGVLLEVGPGQTLAPMIRQHPSAGKDSGVTVLSTLQDGRDEGEAALTALGRLWLEGVEVDWTAFHAAARRRRVALPTYPFERKRYWIEPPPQISPEMSLATVQEETSLCQAQNPRRLPTDPHAKPSSWTSCAPSLKDLSGQDQSGADINATFLELGFDSLFLTQVAGAFRKEFGIKVTFRQLLEDFSTMDTLAGHLDAQLPPEAMRPAPPPAAAPVPVPANGSPGSGRAARGIQPPAPRQPLVARTEGMDTLERVIQEQLRVMAQQLGTIAWRHAGTGTCRAGAACVAGARGVYSRARHIVRSSRRPTSRKPSAPINPSTRHPAAG